ncbi:capsular polysaccharide biosynthesis protein [Oleiphilus messinensis]|uniref:Capsular polysaccharide biosynthesis protein n=2 Tax=Oleiphilus messinensis TaxID=141451 RepID=A0A1Y0I9L4_9GAMM|nr:capsular polysaccharide biosynthesis protein [Oleiphilus messinensis]
MLVVSSLFPSPDQPNAGVFIKERMFRLNPDMKLTVLSPRPWFPGQSIIRKYRPNYRPETPAYQNLEGVDVYYPKFFSLPAVGRLFDWFFMFVALLIWDLRNRNNADIVDSHFAYPDGVAACSFAKLTRRKVSVTLRGTEIGHSQHPLKRWLMVKVLNSVDRVFSVSDSLRRHVIKLGVQERQVLVVGNGVDTEKFYPVDSIALRAKLVPDEKAKILITVGGLVERKGFHRVIEILPKLNQSFPEGVYYLAVGGPSPEGDWSDKLRNMALEAGVEDKVIFTGPVKPAELGSYLSAADLFVLSTRNEGWANVILESMACGVPVIATDVGGNSEVVSTPDVGEIVPFEDADALFDAIQKGLSRSWDKTKIIDYAKANSWNTRIMVLREQFARMTSHDSHQFSSQSAYTRFVSSLIFPLHERLKKHSSVSLKKQLEESQWYSPGAVSALQNRNLRSFMQFVHANVPYYTELLDKRGLKPADFKTAKDLGKLPLLTKADIRQNEVSLKSKVAGQLVKYNTGGSSGQPLVFYMGMDRVSHDVASKWRATRWWQVDIGDPEIVLWGSPIELGGQDRVKQIRDYVLRTKLISAFDLTDQSITEILQQILDEKPPMLFGYPSVFALLAQEARKRNMDMANAGVKVVFVTSEKLYDHQREIIEAVFQAPVANGYGGRDAGFIAHQCPEGNFHITAEHIIVETVDELGSPVAEGEAGQIVVTHLMTKDFPFIRYATGDVGVLGSGQCACGRGLPILKDIQGRSTDFVKASDGTIMHGLALIYFVREHAGIQNYKIVQESLDKTRLLLEIDETFEEQSKQDITQNFQRRLGKNVQIEIEIVDSIPAEKSGKYRYVISHV